MHIVEEAEYKVACHVDRKDLRLHGITVEDVLNRTPLGRMFIKKAAELAKESTDYSWPGCGFSMQMDFYTDDFVLIFSERIDDFLYNLRQSALALPKEQAKELERIMNMIRLAEDEEEARQIIRNFEESIREMQC